MPAPWLTEYSTAASVSAPSSERVSIAAPAAEAARASGCWRVPASSLRARLLTLAFSHYIPLIVFWLMAAGAAWTTTTSTLNVAVQLSVPDWVQARALGIYQMVFAGGMAAGSALWGLIAEARFYPDGAAVARRSGC